MTLPKSLKNVLEKINFFKKTPIFNSKEKSLKKIELPAYFDSTSTSPMDPRCLDAMLPYLTYNYGNPHSRTHAYGWISESAIDKAREKISDLINSNPFEIIYTSGATEASNLAINGICKYELNQNKPVHIITTQYEHKSVLDTCRHLEEEGVEVSYIPIKTDGTVDPEEIRKVIKPHTKLVSIMTINNEIGTINPLKEIGKICRENNIYFHTDAAQAFGKIPLNVNDMNIDLMSISGHKIYGPKGIGALYIRKKPRVRLSPIIFGGGQERGLRSGTVPVPLVVGLGKAAEIAKKDMDFDSQLIKEKSDKFVNYIKSKVEVIRNGSIEKNWPGCINLSFPYVEGEGLLMKLKDFALSSGSACTSASLEPSYVLRALGNDDVLAHSSIRFSFNRFTTDEEVEKLAKQTIKGAIELRNMSPLAEMVEEGMDLNTIDWS